MPLPAERLSPGASRESIQQAISDSIAQCIAEGGEPEQCSAMSHDMARKATRNGSGNLQTRQIRSGLEDRNNA